tara:strand:- start:2157 stop:2948 length:792 start_codon:yes stop_codon:yes gene_type:complete
MKLFVDDGWNCTIHNSNLSERYKEACTRACSDDHAFSTFRRDPHYMSIVGCDTHGRQTGQTFLDWVDNHYPHLLEKAGEFRKSDSMGSPITFDYDRWGVMSPNTTRLIKVCGEIGYYFGSLDNKEIVEIGGSYGGQYHAFSCIWRPDSYTGIDCSEATLLARKFISSFDNNCELSFYDTNNIIARDYDFAISDNCLSEMNSESFDFYMENVISRAQMAYCSMNDYYRKQETIEKFKKVFSDVKVIKDDPSSPDNQCYILICRK